MLRKSFRIFRQVLLATLALFLIGACILIFTPMGLDWSIRLAQWATDGNLVIENPQRGTLRHFEAELIAFQTDGLNIEIHQVELDWKPGRLLYNTLMIDTLKAETITVTQSQRKRPRNTPAADFSLNLFAQPYITVIANTLSVDILNLHLLNQDPIVIAPLRATLAYNELGLRLRNTFIQTPQARLDLNANIGPGFTPNIHIESTQHFTPENLPPIEGKTFVRGSLKQWQGTQSLTQDTYSLTIEAKQDNAVFDLKADAEKLALTVHYNAETQSGQFSGKSQDAQFLNAPIKMDVAGTIKNNSAYFTRGVIDLGDNHLTLNGFAGPTQADLKWDLSANNLNDITLFLSGSLLSQGRFTKNNDGMTVQFSASASMLRILDYFAETLSMPNNTFTNVSGKPIRLQLSANNLNLDGVALDTLNVNTNGTPASLTTTLGLAREKSNLSTRVKSEFSESQSNHTIQSFNVNLPTESYQLKTPTTLTLGANNASLSVPFCLRTGRTDRLCMTLTPEQFTLNLNALPYHVLTAFRFPYLNIDGSLTAVLQMSLEQFDITATDLNIALSPMKVTVKRRDQRTLFQTGDGQITLSVKPEEIVSQARFNLIRDDFFAWDLSVGDWHNESTAPLNAVIKGQLTQWDFLRLWITETDDIAGNLNGTLHVSGTVGEPHYSGELALTQGRVGLPLQGVTFTDAHLSLKPNHLQKGLAINGGILSGGGQITLDGSLSLQDTWPALDLRITGTDFEINNRPRAHVFTSPDLTIQTKENNLYLKGKIHIPQAKLNLKGYGSYIGPSPDIIYVENLHETKQALFQIHTDLTLSLGKKIELTAGYLKTALEGSINIKQSGDAMARANGQISTRDGSYAAYGQKVTIDQGILTFNNSLIDNPNLFIEASRPIQVLQNRAANPVFIDNPNTPDASSVHDGRVGIRVSGTVQNPKYTFFSTPPMSEEDQLSYLLTGGPSSTISGAQAAFMFAALSEASNMLGMSDTDSARLQGITGAIGLDFNIETASRINQDTGESYTDTNLVVGKAIRPRLYVSYSVGLLDPMNVFKARYQLSRRWSVQSTTNSQGDAGGDVLYGIETNSLFGMEE